MRPSLLSLCALALPSLTFADTLYFGASVLTLAEGEAPYATGWMRVDEAGYIAAVGPGLPPTAELEASTTKIDLTGKIILPGFVSGHSHLWQSIFRGIAPDGELWPWLMALHRTYGDDIGPGDMGAATAHGALDQLLHGVTTTYNHSHWLDFGPELYFEQILAERTVPQRFIYAHCLPLEESPDVWAAQIEEYFPKTEPSPKNPYMGLSFNVRAYGEPELIDTQMTFIHDLGVVYQLHYLEQSARQVDDRKHWPEYLKHDIVGPQTSFAHFIHTTDEILRDSAERGASMIWNPLSNGRLGSGLAEIPKYLEVGLGVGMGVDGQASADISDPFENMRMGLYATRMREENADGFQPLDILRLHTIETAKVLQLDQYVGTLEAGKFADFLVVDPTTPLTGPVWDVAAHLVFSCSFANLEAVYVGGEKVVDEGAVPGFDLAAIEADVAARAIAIQARNAEDE